MNYMAKIAVVGDKDSVMLFKAVGLDVFFETDSIRAGKRIHKLAGDGYAAIFVTEPLYKECGEIISYFANQPYPSIIPIPDNHGSQGIGIETLKQNVEKAVGVDILFNK